MLKDAQAKGYAEKDPTADIEGYDACRKIAILTSRGYADSRWDFEDIHTEGITKITATDIRVREGNGQSHQAFSIQPQGGRRICGDGSAVPFAGDTPALQCQRCVQCHLCTRQCARRCHVYGSGAGKLPTASAVVADIVDMAKHLDTNIAVEWSSKKLELVDYRNVENCYFVRTSADEKRIEEVFGEVSYVTAEGVSGETGFVTARMSEADYEKRRRSLAVYFR